MSIVQSNSLFKIVMYRLCLLH